MFRPMPLIHQRGSKYVVRRGVPERLRPIIGKREIVSSLDERDPAEAKRRGFAVMAEIQRLFAEAEAELKNPSVRVYKTLHEDAEHRQWRPRGPKEVQAERDAIMEALAKLQHAPGPEAATQRAIFEGLLKQRNSADADEGDNPPLSLVFDRWRAERQPPAQTWEQWNTARRRFESAVGGVDLPVKSITKAHVRAFKEALLKTPARRRGLDRDGRPVLLSPASVQKQLNAVRGVLSWAVRQGYLETNPATGISHARATGRQDDTRRLPYRVTI